MGLYLFNPNIQMDWIKTNPWVRSSFMDMDKNCHPYRLVKKWREHFHTLKKKKKMELRTGISRDPRERYALNSLT